jgi:hypothetical protein
MGDALVMLIHTHQALMLWTLQYLAMTHRNLPGSSNSSNSPCLLLQHLSPVQALQPAAAAPPASALLCTTAALAVLLAAAASAA